MKGPYDDIIDLPHPTSAKHPRMAPMARAAQFSPFDALTGYEAAIQETARLTDQRAELDEDVKMELDRKLRLIAGHPGTPPEVSITYFQADGAKAGGSYLTATGVLKRVEHDRRSVLMTDGRQIPIDDIYKIESAFFSPLG